MVLTRGPERRLEKTDGVIARGIDHSFAEAAAAQLGPYVK